MSKEKIYPKVMCMAVIINIFKKRTENIHLQNGKQCFSILSSKLTQ